MGQHHGGGFESDFKSRAELEAKLRPLLESGRPRLKEWAEYEIRHHESMRRWFQEMDEEDGRT
jgi:hypothetical protein